MEKVIFMLISLMVTTFAFAQKATDNFEGKYKTDDGGIITITKTSTGFVGTDEMKKVVLKDVKFDSKEWKATIYNPKKDMTASGEILLEANRLKIAAHKGFLSKTIYWDIVK